MGWYRDSGLTLVQLDGLHCAGSEALDVGRILDGDAAACVNSETLDMLSTEP